MSLLLALLTSQALLGALDNFWHHEFTERLPAKRWAAGELTLHAALWARMPRYQWASKLFNLPLLRQATELLYDHLISPLLALWARTRARQRQLHPGRS